MISALRPETRRLLVNCRQAAMSGGLAAGLAALQAERPEPSAPPVDRAVAGLLHAEILYLGGRAHDAIASFDTEVAPLLGDLPPETAATLASNRSFLGLAQLRGEGFDEDLDRRRLLALEHWDARAVLGALMRAEAGKHFDALPALWRQVCRTDQKGSWLGRAWAYERLGREQLAIGALVDALWSALMAVDEDLSRDVGDALVARRDPAAVRAAVTLIQKVGKLARHAQIGCIVLQRIADAVPDDHIPAVFAWVLRHAGADVGDFGFENRVAAAWEALQSLTHRLDEEHRVALVRAAAEHPFWRKPHRTRHHLIQAAHHAVASGVPEAVKVKLAARSVPLATSQKDDSDYIHAVNLLCQLAEGTPAIQQSVRTALYPPGQQAVSSVLAQAAPVLGHSLGGPDVVSQWADRAAALVRKQVQRLPLDAQPEPGAMMYATQEMGDHKLVVAYGLGSLQLGAMTRHKEHLAPFAAKTLVEAMLAMARHPQNSTVNRSLLVKALGELGDALDGPLAVEVASLLAVVARGELAISDPTSLPAGPMSRFRVNDGSEGDLRGGAVYALAQLARAHPGLQTELDPILDAALLDPDPELRRIGFAAGRVAPALSPSALTAVLMGTQDSDVVAARVAWIVLAEVPEVRLAEEHWRALLFALTKASQHPDAHLRRAAASAAVRLVPLAPHGALRDRLAALRAVFAADFCASVRKVARDDAASPSGGPSPQ